MVDEGAPHRGGLQAELMKYTILMILTSVLSLPLLATDSHNFHFENIDISHGLSQNSVMTIAKDRKGFMWLGTEDGLNRYDGVTFKQFRHDPLDQNTLNSSSIYSSLVDKSGNLWIGTYGSGLNLYIDSTESFRRYTLEPLEGLVVGEGSVNALHEDDEGFIWIGTSGAGLYRLDPRNETALHVNDLVSHGDTLADPVVYSLMQDHEDRLWIGTLYGLNVLDLSDMRMTTYRYDESNPASLHDDNVNVVYETFDGTSHRIWVGTNWGGLDIYDPNTDGFIHLGVESERNPDYPETSVNRIHQLDSATVWVGTDSKGIMVLDIRGNLLKIVNKKVYDDTALNDDQIQCFYDDGEILWIGTSGGGVAKFNRGRKKFFNLTYDPLNPGSLHDNRILRIRSDSQDNLWIATWSEGLTYYNTRTHEFTVHKHDPNDPGTISDNGIQDILVDRNDNLWVISSSTKLDVLWKGADTFQHISPDPTDPEALGSDYLLSLMEGSDGRIWMGSWQEGLFSLDPKTMKFQTFRSPGVRNVNLGNISYYAMFEDSKGNIWIGAENEGLIRFNPRASTVEQFKSSPGSPMSLANNDVMCFYEDDEGYLWLGTYGGGLSRFDPRTRTFKNISTTEGMPSSAVYMIFEDEQGALWMSTNNGLVKYHPRQNSIKTYDISDGVLSREFNPGGCQLRSGWLYFGGVKGITYFHPDQIKENTNIPSVHFTDLSIMNVPVTINQEFNGRIVLKRSITLTSELEFTPDDLFFTLSFASLDYYHSSSNNYAYLLEGFDDEWRHLGTQRSVTFTNIPPGEYTLHLKGSNNDLVWSEGDTRLRLIIHPEFYETWWFIIGSILLLLIGFGIAFRLRTKFLIKHGRELEQHNIKLNAEIESRRKAHIRASERANYFRAVIAQSPVPMAIHNSEGNITHLNAGWVELWGVDRPETIIRDYQVDGDALAEQLGLGKAFKKAAEGHIVEIPEVTFTTNEGNIRVVQMLLYPLKNIVGMTNQVMVTIEDVTEIVQQRTLLEKSLVEKDLLLKEVHHRVKNNLQLVASLLGLQKAGTRDDRTLQTLDDIKNRVNSMALVHDALYRSPEFDNVDISTYIQDLTDTLHAAFGARGAPIQIHTSIPEIRLSVDIAVPCGLMINEMVTNALKYAFPDPEQVEKHIIIQFTELEDDSLRLEVLDNGVGMQKPVVWDSVDSLGLYLIKILSEQQLMGSVELKEGPGAHFIIEFPIHPNFDE